MYVLTRRNFMKVGAASLAASSPILSALAKTGAFAAESAPSNLIWGILLHLGHNMWGDSPTAFYPPVDHFACDEKLWEELTVKASQSGLNMLVIDLGEAVQYKSHPEIAIKGAWSVERLREDLDRVRKLGLEPIPKMNFSTCHDFWLGEYSRMVSTPTYYKVCSDLIKEVVEIFDHPRFFHLGYDEETFPHQETFDYVVIRQNELWKHDFLFFVEECEKNGVRPWIWADRGWRHPDFIEWAPKSIVMSNWYYEIGFDPEKERYVKYYLDLRDAGYDQIPTGSSFSYGENIGLTVKFGKENLNNERLLGYLQTVWKFPDAPTHPSNLAAIEQIAAAKAKYYGN